MEPFTLVFDVSIQCNYEAPGSYQGSFICSEWLFPDLFGRTIPLETASMSHNMMIAINTQGRRINKTIFYHYLSPQRPSVKNIGLKNATKVCVVWGIGGVHRTDG